MAYPLRESADVSRLDGVRVLVVDDTLLQAGFQAHVAKPVGMPELVTTVAALNDRCFRSRNRGPTVRS